MYHTMAFNWDRKCDLHYINLSTNKTEYDDIESMIVDKRSGLFYNNSNFTNYYIKTSNTKNSTNIIKNIKGVNFKNEDLIIFVEFTNANFFNQIQIIFELAKNNFLAQVYYVEYEKIPKAKLAILKDFFEVGDSHEVGMLQSEPPVKAKSYQYTPVHNLTKIIDNRVSFLKNGNITSTKSSSSSSTTTTAAAPATSKTEEKEVNDDKKQK